MYVYIYIYIYIYTHVCITQAHALRAGGVRRLLLLPAEAPSRCMINY